ncbi:MAG: M23 family metallopeptidase, partial [Bacteroidales bacterium]
QFSPEKNLYSQINSKERFNDFKYVPISLPFWGEWTVTQAHHGEFTHKKEWAHAWDFEIVDEQGLNFKGTGTARKDFYCYDKPIVSPADGWVEEIVDGVDDNEIGDSNLEQNWGNTIVIKHTDKLYSKLSHIKKGTFKVSKGGQVKKGDILANCGNSGRSPKPHIHFQIQETPFIGSKTLDYPIGHYILHNPSEYKLQSYSRPEKDQTISNIEKNKTLYRAFHFVPGQQLKFIVKPSETGKEREVTWEVVADIYNNTYLHCLKTKSKAWFKNDGNIHYFTHFEGNRSSLLFYFYLGAYKVTGGFYKGLKINDHYPIHLLNNQGLIFLQDFIAPFYLFVKSKFELQFLKMKDNLNDSVIVFRSEATVEHANKTTRKVTFEFEIESNRIKGMTVADGNKSLEAREIQTLA